MKGVDEFRGREREPSFFFNVTLHVPGLMRLGRGEIGVGTVRGERVMSDPSDWKRTKDLLRVRSYLTTFVFVSSLLSPFTQPMGLIRLD